MQRRYSFTGETTRKLSDTVTIKYHLQKMWAMEIPACCGTILQTEWLPDLFWQNFLEVTYSLSWELKKSCQFRHTYAYLRWMRNFALFSRFWHHRFHGFERACNYKLPFRKGTIEPTISRRTCPAKVVYKNIKFISAEWRDFSITKTVERLIFSQTFSQTERLQILVTLCFRYPSGEERCIACKLCEAICPAQVNFVAKNWDMKYETYPKLVND